ncbi:ribonuclease domain-containing protein [Nocardia sp. NPDC051030]|uniref:ribonuclease domain-containing protein n=1 Tax=Nocardia sp. NPDC051030 TaxID=3155162 RepID=UPI003412BE98
MTISKKMRAWLLLGVAVALLLVAVVASRGGDQAKDTSSRAVATATAGKTTAPKPGGTKPGAVDQTTAVAPSRVAGVPDRVYATLAEIDAGRWPDSANAPGTKGGDTWMNRSRTLPTQDSDGKRITYQEWDVNPKKRGQDRDAERIVTGSDGSAWYTSDHYGTFTRIR